MRHILQGFTMFLDGLDYGLDTEEVGLPFPTPVTQEYRGGAMDMSISQPMSALEAMTITVKMAGQNPEIMKRMGLGPGKTQIVTFRAGVLTESNGIIVPHICVVEGCINGTDRDRWSRGEKVGFEFAVNGINYLRYEADQEIIHELRAYPPRRIINGVDQLAALNAALGY